MWQLAAVLVACTLLAGVAHAQVTSQFWVITENGNSFVIDGPPPERPPGFDSAPFLNTQTVDTALSLTAGGAGGVGPLAVFGEAGAVTILPPFDSARTEMEATIVRDWGRPTDSKPLYSPILVGDLKLHAGSPYLGPAMANTTAVDLLELCNAGWGNGTYAVSCVDNSRGTDIRPAHVPGYGHVLDLSATGRTIIHVENSGPTRVLEIMFTCPECRADALAYYGFNHGPDRFLTRGFEHPASVTTPPPPYAFGPGNLTGLAWDSVEDSGVTYWQNGTGGCTPALNIVGGNIQGGCAGDPIEAGTVLADVWRPLPPGWSSMSFPTGAYIIISDPGFGAKLQIREGMVECCQGFAGNLRHDAREPGQPAKAAVIHDTDRHLLIIPYGGSVPGSHPTLAEAQYVQGKLPGTHVIAPRWLAHSDPADPVYHGFLYDERGAWPPYQVRLVEARHMHFIQPALDVTANLAGSNYTHADLLNVLRMRTDPGPLLDSEIYDIRNDKLLRTDEGSFRLWDGSFVDRIYIQPWWNLQKNPVWETYGVDLPEDRLVVVDFYATVPVVKPTRLAGTYLSSLPCGYPDPAELTGQLRDAVFAAATNGGYDDHLIDFLFHADWSGPIDENLMLQHVYMASRTYLDYLDGDYQAGEEIHVPLLGNRPYLCTVIAPNILESQYLLYGLPFGESYLSLGGTEGIAEASGGFGTGWSATFLHRAGVQSPRDGVLALDVTARFGASASSMSLGYAAPSRTAHSGQWANGTIQVGAQMTVGESTVDLGSWTIDTYEVAEESYLLDVPWCYGRFVTVPDNSGYIVKTITTSASQGEHIPVTLNLTATENNAVVGTGPFPYGSTSSFVIRDSTTEARAVTATNSGTITTASLTLDWDDVNGYESIAVYGGGSYNGGTLVSVTTPGGTTHTLTPHSDYAGNSHTFDLGFLAGEEMAGTWTITLNDQGYIPTASGNNLFDNTLNSWELEFTRTAGMTAYQVCEGTSFESTVIQFLLKTFVVDVR